MSQVATLDNPANPYLSSLARGFQPILSILKDTGGMELESCRSSWLLAELALQFPEFRRQDLSQIA